MHTTGLDGEFGFLQRPDTAIALGDPFHAEERVSRNHRQAPERQSHRGVSPAAHVKRSDDHLLSLV